jgi:hypothetical protein
MLRGQRLVLVPQAGGMAVAASYESMRCRRVNTGARRDCHSHRRKTSSSRNSSSSNSSGGNGAGNVSRHERLGTRVVAGRVAREVRV